MSAETAHTDHGVLVAHAGAPERSRGRVAIAVPDPLLDALRACHDATVS